MLNPVNAIIKNAIGNIIFRGNVVTGIVDVDNGDGSYDVFIAESDVAYPKIFTLSISPNLAVGDTVRILYKNGIKELPIILPPVSKALQLFENQLTPSVGWASIYKVTIQKAQHFTVESNHTLEKIGLYLLKKTVGQAGGTAYIDIYNADGNGFPTGDILATTTIDTSLLPAKNSEAEWFWTEYTFDSPIDLTSGSEIVIVVRYPDATYIKTIYWGLYVPTDASGRGIESADTGSSWVKDIGGYLPGGIPLYTDFTFKIYGK